MNKNVYSLVLSEDIIREIDRIAYLNNTNRSSMINEILAGYVSYITPEQRVQRLLSNIRNHFMESSILLLPATSSAMMNMKTALAYKYNPTVRYSLEISRAPLPEIGCLRVSMRTQNPTLIHAMEQFFRLWHDIESSLIGPQECEIQGERYQRVLRLQSPDDPNSIALGHEELGSIISQYIGTLDQSLKIAFSDTPHEEKRTAITDCFRSFLANQRIII